MHIVVWIYFFTLTPCKPMCAAKFWWVRGSEHLTGSVPYLCPPKKDGKRKNGIVLRTKMDTQTCVRNEYTQTKHAVYWSFSVWLSHLFAYPSVWGPAKHVLDPSLETGL